MLSQGVSQAMWAGMKDFPAGFLDYGLTYMSLTDIDGRKKPHYHSYKLLINKLNGFEKAEIINFNPRIIKFNFPEKKSVFVVWSDKPETIDFYPYVSGTKLKVTNIITEQGQTEPIIIDYNSVHSVDQISISETPIFVEEI